MSVCGQPFSTSYSFYGFSLILATFETRDLIRKKTVEQIFEILSIKIFGDFFILKEAKLSIGRDCISNSEFLIKAIMARPMRAVT